MFVTNYTLYKQLVQVLANQKVIMSGVSDLNAAVAKVTTDVVALTTAVNAVIAALQAGGITDAQAETLAQTLQAGLTQIEADTAAAQGAVAPPPAGPAKG